MAFNIDIIMVCHAIVNTHVDDLLIFAQTGIARRRKLRCATQIIAIVIAGLPRNLLSFMGLRIRSAMTGTRGTVPSLSRFFIRAAKRCLKHFLYRNAKPSFRIVYQYVRDSAD